MENSLSVPAHADELCAACSVTTTTNDVFCTNCGYPLKGTEKDQRYFMSKRQADYIDLGEFNKKIRTAGNSLYYLAGIFVLFGIIVFFTKRNDPEFLGYVLPNLILAVLFLALGGFSRKKPLACLISGLSLYVIVQVLNAVNNPTNIVSGVIFKIAIIGYLIKGIKSALEVEKFKKEHNLI